MDAVYSYIGYYRLPENSHRLHANRRHCIPVKKLLILKICLDNFFLPIPVMDLGVPVVGRSTFLISIINLCALQNSDNILKVIGLAFTNNAAKQRRYRRALFLVY